MRLSILIALLLPACAAGSLETISDEPDTGAPTADGGTADTGSATPDATPTDSATTDSGAPSSDTSPATDSGTTPDAPSGALHFERSYGNGTSLMGGWGAGVTLGVLITDSTGKPAVGVPVTWSSRAGDFAYFPGALGGTSLVVATDESGWSTPSINAPNPTVPIVESVMTATLAGGVKRDFYVMTTNNGDSLGPAGQQAFTGPDNPNHAALGPYEVGKTYPGALTFTLVCSNATKCYGLPIANVGVRIALTDGSSGKSDPRLDPPAECVGGEPLSDAKGVVRCDLRIKRKFSGTLRAAVGQFTEFEYSLTTK